MELVVTTADQYKGYGAGGDYYKYHGYGADGFDKYKGYGVCGDYYKCNT